MDQLRILFNSASSKRYTKQLANPYQKKQRWWGAVWRGLPVEPTGKHYRAMRCSVWLYLYLVIHADRKTGTLYRVVATIASDMGISHRTIRLWLSRLKKHRYIEATQTGRAQKILITKWKGVSHLY